MEFVLSGREALDRLAEFHFDVLVTGVRLPEVDGASLLTEARKRFPKTVRIVLSGQTKQDALLQVIGSAHQFIPMPCDAETMKRMIVRACAVRHHLTNSSLRELVGQVSSVPTIPTLYDQLVGELNSPKKHQRCPV